MSEENKTQNPLLERARMPGSTFTLPSQGLFYKNGELAESVKDGEVHIYPMVTRDEILFKTPDLLYSGEAIVQVFAHCVPDVKKPLDLLAKDMDFIMTALRKVTYGEFMEILYTHDCENAKEHSYQIPMTPFLNQSKRIDPTSVTSNYTIKLENDQEVSLVPPRFRNVLKIYQSTGKEDADVNELTADLYDTVSNMIYSVDEITDRAMIREWVESIKAGWIHQISNQVETVSDWGPEFKTKVKCLDCGKEMPIVTPINPLAFFI